MTSQASSSDQKKTAPAPALWRPEETFWQHYSPYHEFPLATVSACTLCGLALGTLFLLWLLNAFDLNNEADGPPRMDAVSIQGGGGGLDGLGTGSSPLASAAKTELAPDASQVRPASPRPADAIAPLPADLKANPLTPASPLDFKEPSDDTTPFAKLQKEANRAALEEKIAAERAAARKALPRGPVDGSGGPPGGRNSPGSGGGTGGGIGAGVGTRVGPGTGGGNGRPLTTQEIHANRWKFTFYSDPEQHVQKLIAMGATYIITAPDRSCWRVKDLRRTPVELVQVKPIDPKVVVAWTNRDVLSLRGLAQRLRLSFMPLMGTITLPVDVEEKVAAVEREAMEKQGRREETIRLTHFDLRLVNGVYEPYVLGFE